MSSSPALTNSTNFSNFANNTSYGQRLANASKRVPKGAKLGLFPAGSLFSSAPKVPTLAPYALPATIIASIMQPVIDKIKSMYDDKFKELKLGKYAETSVKPTSSESSPYTPPVAIIPPKVAPNSSDTLISVLKDSSSNVEGISRSVLYSNELIIKSLEDFQKLISLNSDIDVAYREIELENSLITNEHLMTIANSLKSTYDNSVADSATVQAYRDENLSVLLDISSSLDSLKSSFSGGLKVTKGDLENALISKKLDHLTFDTTPIQVDNLGDEIPQATPQQMRAIKDAVVAKKNSDENTFEIDDDDLFDMFEMPDISSMFDRNDKTVRNSEVNATF